MPRRRLRWRPRWLLGVGAAAALTVASTYASKALAAGTWTTTMTVDAVGQGATMPAGQPPTATVIQGTVTIAWGPSTLHSGREVDGYILNRQALDGTGTVQVCAVAAPKRSCQDSPEAGQAVMYTVVPTAGLWRGPASAPSAPVDPPASPTPSASSTLPASPSASSSPTPTTTPSGSPAPTPTASPTATASASPTTAASPSPSPAPSPS